MKLTDSDMLTEVVKREEWTPKTSHGHSMIFNYVSNDLRAHFYLGESCTSDLSLPDLIADHEFMKAVYGGDCLSRSEWCQMPGHECDETVTGISCTIFRPAWQYRALEALKLLHDPEGNAIKYLYDNLPKGEGI